MPSKLYELRAFKGDRPVRTPNRLVDALDFSDPDRAKDLLTRHLLGVAERDGAHRRDAHRYHLDIHEIVGDRVNGTAFRQFSVPVQA